MKIRNLVKGLALVGATAALLPLGSAVAGGPGFDGINVKTGTTGELIGCPAGTTCTPLISGDGFLQQEVRLGTETYIQTIIIDPLTGNAASDIDVSTLAFSDITFIQMSGSSNGIKGMQRLTDDPLNTNAADTTGNLFTGTTELLIGTWADDASKQDINIVQSFRDNSSTGTAIGAAGASQTEDDFVNTFTLGINLVDGSTVQTGKRMDMVQDVGMASDVASSAPGDDFQRFVIRQRSGDQMTGAGTLTLAAASTGSPGATGGSVTWTGTDDVMVTWLGQRVNLGGTGSAIFGFESIDNLSETADPISTFSTSHAVVTDAPFAWDATNFGTAPTL